MLGLKSKLLIGSLIAITTVATAVGIGVGISQQTKIDTSKQDTNVSNNPSEFVPNKKQDDQVSVDNNENSEKPDPILVDALSKFSNSDISFIEKRNSNNQLNKQDHYPYTITNQNIKLNKANKSIDPNVQFLVRTTTKNNNIKNLNDGKLSVVLIAIRKDEDETKSLSKEFQISGFKQADKQLLTTFTKNNGILDLTTQEDKTKPLYVSINDLNSKIKRTVSKQMFKGIKPLSEREMLNDIEQKDDLTGLNYLFKHRSSFVDTLKKDEYKSVAIEGTVYLSDIEKNDSSNLPVFKLLGGDSGIIRLVQKDSNNQKEVKSALIEEIKVSNLLPDDISLTPVSYNQQATRNYIKELENDSTNKGFSKLTDIDNQLNHHFYINLKDDSIKQLPQEETSVFIKPYLVEQNQMTKDFAFNFVIGFGDENRKILLRSNNKKDLDLLKTLGLTLNVYYKTIEANKSTFKADNITSITKLSTYLKATNFTKPVNLTDLDKHPNEFKKFEVKTTSLNELINLNEIEPNKSSLLVFINYSYTGMKENEALFANSLSAIISNIANE